MGASSSWLRAAAAIAPAAHVASGCTFTGLGNYDVETCARPRGLATTPRRVGALSDLTISSASGKNVIGAFAASVMGGSCIEAVGANDFLNPNCLFLADETSLVPRQPMVVPISGGNAAAIIATTAPCTKGALRYRFTAPGFVVKADAPCDMTGAALPSIAPLSDGSTAVVAWYATSLDSRSDPIGGCAGANAVPLQLAVVSAATSGPMLGAPITLSTTSTSVRSAAMAPVPGHPQAILAAPVANDVGVWTVGTTSPGAPVAIPGLAGARAVAIAVASDGSGRVGVAAEIGCSPQSIAFAVGTLAEGFPNVTVVVPSGGDLAVSPSVAWVEAQSRWVVAWISTKGGAHVLARWFDATGKALGAVADPAMSATAAAVTSTGDIFGFVASSGSSGSSGSFVNTSLGCTP